MKKDIRDIKKEFGYILRWTHPVIEQGEQPKKDCIYLESENDRFYIVDYDENVCNQEAYDFIKKKTYNGFRDKSSIDCYNNYVKLFEIMNIKKKDENSDRKKQYIKVIEKAIENGIINNDFNKLSLLMDLESADLKFDLDFDKWLNADEFNFTHDFVGIVNNIERDKFPCTNFNFFVPRFARTIK